ncbi:hypothetical protein C0989_007390 [Termitomyces sp. Mn162]|nr:hypothetical protein C0989_007390 [Termitomyces sp. Mn162]
MNSLPEDNVWESFKATVLNLLAPGTPLTFSTLSNQLTFMAMTQQSTSSKAAFKANSNAKSKFKNKLDMWCQFHNSSTHNTANHRTLKEKDDKKEKGRAWKKKRKKRQTMQVTTLHWTPRAQMMNLVEG